MEKSFLLNFFKLLLATNNTRTNESDKYEKNIS